MADKDEPLVDPLLDKALKDGALERDLSLPVPSTRSKRRRDRKRPKPKTPRRGATDR